MKVSHQKLLLPLLWLVLGSCSQGGDASRPSVILVSIDTLRADHVGVYGYPRSTTPFLDEWARQATVFERAFSTSAWTLVAHMTLLTGLLPEQHGVLTPNKALASEVPLLAEHLRAAGYRTHALYQEGWIHERHGFDRGFDSFRKHDGLEQADLHLRSLLPELEGERPFFLFLHVFDVHCGDLKKSASPYPAPEPYERLFAEGLPPLPDLPLEEMWHTPNVLDSGQKETLAALYDGGIRHVDDQLGRWFAELETRGLDREALVIVTADHGEALGQHGRLDQHGDSWQEALHVPLIVRDPNGRGAGERISQPVHLGDLVPTILEAAGLPRDPRLPGVPLFGAIPEERVIYGIKLPEAFVLKWPRKLVRGAETCRAVDLVRDPGELAPSQGDLAEFEALRSEALGAHVFPEARAIEKRSALERAELEDLGYGAGEER